MQRYWISWYSGNYADEGCTKPPFQFWCSGSRMRQGDGDRDEQVLCAVVDCIGHPDDHLKDIRRVLKEHYPDFTERFIEPQAHNWTPGDRFPDFKGLTSLGRFTLRTGYPRPQRRKTLRGYNESASKKN